MKTKINNYVVNIRDYFYLPFLFVLLFSTFVLKHYNCGFMCSLNQ